MEGLCVGSALNSTCVVILAAQSRSRGAQTSQCRDERLRRGLVLYYPLRQGFSALKMRSYSSGQLPYSCLIASLRRRLPSPDQRGQREVDQEELKSLG